MTRRKEYSNVTNIKANVQDLLSWEVVSAVNLDTLDFLSEFFINSCLAFSGRGWTGSTVLVRFPNPLDIGSPSQAGTLSTQYTMGTF